MRVPAFLSEALEQFEPVIGLEVHAQLKTRSKLFSTAANAYDPGQPNQFISAYCLGLPGVLPVVNAKAVELAVRAGLALDCQIRSTSIWSRKQYFYPDLPKGYQISQYDEPVCEHGHLDIQATKGPKTVRILRIHMEEDAGKSVHVDGSPYSLVDYNRAGVPLIEIVSEPDLRSAQDTVEYLKQLRAILRAIDACDGNMEEGSFRCDANVSIRPIGETKLGTRCEIKNVNSFRFVEQAIEYEILRQAQRIAKGDVVVQETRLFDSAKKETRSMRSKEEAHDYRYFPDPDLPPLVLDDAWIEEIKTTLPELPEATKARWRALGVPEEHVETFVEDQALARFFDAAIEKHANRAVGIAQLIKGELLRELKTDAQGVDIEALGLRPEDLAMLVELRESDKISSTQQKKLFTAMLQKGTPLATLLKDEGQQVEDPEVLKPIVDRIVAANPDVAMKLKNGNQGVMGFFVGQVMKATQGKAKPALVRQLIEDAIAKQP